jgi:hypothetical protein
VRSTGSCTTSPGRMLTSSRVTPCARGAAAVTPAHAPVTTRTTTSDPTPLTTTCVPSPRTQCAPARGRGLAGVSTRAAGYPTRRGVPPSVVMQNNAHTRGEVGT